MNYDIIILGSIGPWQIILILLIIVLMFGGKKIPQLMKGLGEGIAEFKNYKNKSIEETKD